MSEQRQYTQEGELFQRDFLNWIFCCREGDDGEQGLPRKPEKKEVLN